MDVRLGIVVAGTHIQYEVIADSVAVHHEAAHTQSLEVGDDKAPAIAAVVLVLATHASAQLVLAQRVAQL